MGVVGVGVERVQHLETDARRGADDPRQQALQAGLGRSTTPTGRASAWATSRSAREHRSSVIAGPCAVESREQVLATARWVKREGATLLRGGAFKPRIVALRLPGPGRRGPQAAGRGPRRRPGLPIVSEITDPADVRGLRRVRRHAPGRRPQHAELRAAQGRAASRQKPVLLKRGLSSHRSTSCCMAAEYILSSGNPNVVLCERGIRTFETATRNTLDLSRCRCSRSARTCPIIVDPSHGTGHRPLVRPMAVAGAAVGADGIIIEVHPEPPTARSDSEQSLSFPEFGDLMDDLRRHEYLRQPTAPHAQAHIEPPAERKRLRARIDDVDARIAALLEERAELSVAVQQTRDADDHGHDVSRERELLEQAARSRRAASSRPRSARWCSAPSCGSRARPSAATPPPTRPWPVRQPDRRVTEPRRAAGDRGRPTASTAPAGRVRTASARLGGAAAAGRQVGRAPGAALQRHGRGRGRGHRGPPGGDVLSMAGVLADAGGRRPSTEERRRVRRACVCVAAARPSARGLPGRGGETLDCGNAGTAMRLLIGALAGRPASGHAHR